MKKFNVNVETSVSVHCFSFEAEDMKSALDRLKNLGLTCLQITELRDNWKGRLRLPEEMYEPKDVNT